MPNAATWSKYAHVRRIRELVKAGPVSAAELYRQAMPLVPPGLAWRSREDNRRRVNEYAGKPVYKREVTDRAILAGQRREVYRSISHLVQNGGAYEYFDGPDGEPWIRAKPPGLSHKERGKLGWANLTAEQRRERGMKIAESRKRNRSLRQSSEQPEPSMRE